MAATNLDKRDTILPSERARAYQMILSEQSKSGVTQEVIEQFIKTTFSEKTEDELTSREIARIKDAIKNVYTVSRTQLHRFLRLNLLIPELIQKVDDNTLAIRTGEYLSYATKSTQQNIHAFMVLHPDLHITSETADTIRLMSHNATVDISQSEINSLLLSSSQVVGTTAEGIKKSAPAASSAANAASSARSARNYMGFIRELARDKVLNRRQKKELQSLVKTAVARVEAETIEDYLRSIDKYDQVSVKYGYEPDEDEDIDENLEDTPDGFLDTN
jgi:hypothetical protein